MNGKSVDKLTVILCDDHRMFREGAKRILDDEGDITVVGDVPSVDEATRLATALTPTVIVLDISLGSGKSGLDGVEILKDRCPTSKILIVSMHQERTFVRASFARGASGYVTKDAAADDLAAAIRIVSRGDKYVPKFIAESNESSTQLTAREREVLELLAAGHTSAEISKVLHLSIRTVETYRSQLARKFDVATRAELIHTAKVRGIL
jgi:DNA-binding NarL/FixJ family response regulator